MENLKKLSLWERQELASNYKTSAEVLTILAQDAFTYVRVKVARNQNTPAEVLTALAQDEDELVRRSVAENLNSPAETLKLLAQDENKNGTIEELVDKKEVIRLCLKNCHGLLNGSFLFGENIDFLTFNKLNEGIRSFCFWENELAKKEYIEADYDNDDYRTQNSVWWLELQIEKYEKTENGWELSDTEFDSPLSNGEWLCSKEYYCDK